MPTGRRSTVPDRCSSRRADAPALSGPSHSGGSGSPAVGPNRDTLTAASRRATSLATATAAKAIVDRVVTNTAMAIPPASRGPRGVVAPDSRRATPIPLNRLVARSASSHG